MFSIARTPENIRIFNTILNISTANGRLINNIKLAYNKLFFTIKNDDPFIICEFLDGDQISNLMDIEPKPTKYFSPK